LLTFATKRAQIPFSSWLPAAIAAPTPVSSLVHSSTLVTAGIFLIIRFHLCLGPRYLILYIISLLTLLIAGLVANLEWDIKKIIAFSTLSQLGFMVFSISLGLIFFCFFHLLCHALFKASLFISSGIIIHNSDRGQEFRRISKFSSLTFVVRARVLVRLMCLCGFPFLSGFFSKDYILDSSRISLILFSCFLFAVFLTTCYSLRFCFYSIITLLSEKNKIFKIYDSLFYITMSAWIFSLVGVLLGSFWCDVLRVFSYYRFFSLVWKILYMGGFLLFFFFIFFFYFFWSCKIYFKIFFLRCVWYLNRLISFRQAKRFFKFGMFHSLQNSQGWGETWGPQKSFQKYFFFSFYFFRDQSLSFFSLLGFFVLICLNFSWMSSLNLKLGFEGATIFFLIQNFIL
jgi:NADH-ubiquinone oxidoreductase chain 5